LLRQGRPDAGHGGRPRLRAGALRGRAGGEFGMTRSAFRREDVTERLDRALAAARGQADGVEVLFRGREANLMRLAEARIVQASDVVQGQVTVRAVVNGTAATWTTSDLSDAGLAAAVRQAIETARHTPPARE